MRELIVGLGTLLLLSGCAEEAPKPKKTKAQALQPGEYEVTSTVEVLRSTDSTTPKTRSKVGDPPKVTRVCVPADGSVDAAAFVEAGESCTATDTYLRGGRMSLQFKCTRGSDQLTQTVDGDFEADSFKARVQTGTYFSGSGDYELVRNLTAKRVGDCPAAAQ